MLYIRNISPTHSTTDSINYEVLISVKSYKPNEVLTDPLVTTLGLENKGSTYNSTYLLISIYVFLLTDT